MKLDKALLEYGLNVKEAKLYLVLLESGRMGVLALSKLLKRNRTGLYYTLEELSQKGLVEEVMIGKKRYWKAVDPDLLMAKENERQKLLANLMPELRATYNSLSGKPRITYYEGIDGINKLDDDLIAYMATLPEDMRDIIEYARVEDIFSGKFFKLAETSKDRKKIKAHVRQIAPDTKQARDLIKNIQKDSFRSFLLVPDYGQAKNIIYLISGNKIAYYFLDENDSPSAILIEDKAQAQIQKELFNQTWKALSK